MYVIINLYYQVLLSQGYSSVIVAGACPDSAVAYSWQEWI